MHHAVQRMGGAFFYFLLYCCNCTLHAREDGYHVDISNDTPRMYTFSESRGLDEIDEIEAYMVGWCQNADQSINQSITLFD